MDPSTVNSQTPAPVARACALCGGAVTPGAAFCPTCGTADTGQGWFVSVDGQATGPYEWPGAAALVQQAGPGRTMVWHQSLGTWTAASGLPGFKRRRRRNWVLPVGVVGAVIVVGLSLGLGLGLGLASGDGVPVADTPMVAPTTGTFPGQVWNAVAEPGQAGTLSGGGAAIDLPEDAVSAATPVALTLVDGPYEEQGFGTAPVAGHEDEAVRAASAIFDVGPAGTRFKAPVRVTIPYDEKALPAGTAEKDVFVMYFDGAQWVPLSTRVDTDGNTAQIALRSFDGSLIAVGVIAAGAAVLGYVHWGLYDPIQKGTAHKWVTPRSPTVEGRAQQAIIGTYTRDAQGKVVFDPASVAELRNKPAVAEMTKKGQPLILGYKDIDGTLIVLQGKFSEKENTNWQMPAVYFGKNDLVGDCTDFANGTVSVLRNLGYQAKGVSGYDASMQPHVWVEAVIGGQPFLIDNADGGMITPPSEAVRLLKLTRPEVYDNRCAMWDENGQEFYRDDWWNDPNSTTTTTSATPTTDAPTTGAVNPADLPLDHGYVLDSYIVATGKSDPGKRRIYVTSILNYEDEGHTRCKIHVEECEVDARGNVTPVYGVYGADMPTEVDGSSAALAAARAEAAQAIATRMAAEGMEAR